MAKLRMLSDPALGAIFYLHERQTFPPVEVDLFRRKDQGFRSDRFSSDAEELTRTETKPSESGLFLVSLLYAPPEVAYQIIYPL